MERYVIHVTKECNCDCVYCYEKDKTSKYTWEEVKELIDKIVKHRTSDEFGIEFLGGEPMLAWDLIKKSYEYLEGTKEVNIVDYVITTNGTIMNEEIADYLSKNKKIRFAVSMDGHKWSNQLRVFKDSRKNTYDKVMENINFLKKYGVESSIHITSHPYNIGFLSESIDHLYKQGIKNIDVGTVESTIKIDKEYCDRFIKELDLVSQKIVDGTYPDLHIGLFEWLKPYEDVRSYIKDPKTGKVVAESYGRSGNDITHTNDYEVVRCEYKDDISEMIYHIRKTVYDNHQRRLKEVRNNDN
jgi:sulfatase maturation enzyme AslB (radical SAM superfamily)